MLKDRRTTEKVRGKLIVMATAICGMDDDQPSARRPTSGDAPDLSRIMNEFLIALFLPAIIVFVLVWALFRLYFDHLLLSIGLGRMTPDQLAFIAIESGYGRFFLLIITTAVIVSVFIGCYLRFIRSRLKDRNIV